MSFLSFRMTLALGAALLAASCAFRFEDPAPGTGEPTGLPPPPKPGNNATLAFEDKGTLALAPGEERTVTVKAEPADHYEISFALLSAPQGASLNKSKVVADSDGRASVTLKAPNSAATFELLASIKDGGSVAMPVAVSDKGFGSLRVIPVYMGPREVTTWVASAVTGTNCAAIADLLPKDLQAPQNATAPAGDEPLIESVPVGPNVAVVLRAGYYMWGCTDEPNLKAGEELDVKVAVFDRPIDLFATNLDVELPFDAEGMPYTEIMKDASVALVGGLLPSSLDGASNDLLNAMIEASPPDVADALTQERAAKDWDGLVGQHLAALATPPKEQILQWIEGKLKAEGDPPKASSLLTGRLVAAGEAAPGKALFAVKTFGGVSAEDAGIPASHLMGWTADASDTVMLGGTLFWMPSRYVGGVALEAAKEAMPGVTTMSDALSALFGCADIAASLGGGASCDAACLEGLCHAALGELWKGGLDASADAGIIGEIEVKAAGLAKVDDYAAPMSFKGTWIGMLASGSVIANLTGDAFGAPAAPDDVPDPP